MKINLNPNKININIYDMVALKEYQIEIEDCFVIDMFNYLLKNKYIPKQFIKNEEILQYIIYFDDDNIFIQNNKLNHLYENKFISEIIKEKNQKTFYVYYEPKRYNMDTRDIRCLYGCPSSKRIQNRNNIEALNLVEVDYNEK